MVDSAGPHRTVVAFGHTFPDLSIEQGVLSAVGARVVNGNGLPADSPIWSEAAGVLLGTAEQLSAARLKAMPRCQAVVRYGMGYDNIDVAAAKALGISVGIVRDYCIDEVAEHTIACALALCRGLIAWDRNVRAGAWRRGPNPGMQRISRLCFAIAGFGLIGRAVARRARGLFGRVAVYDPWATPSVEDAAQGFEFVPELGELLAIADVLSVHVPLIPETRGLIGADALRRLKPSTIVINVSRGGIVDEAALLDAVRCGALHGAALDTFTQEPLPADHPFIAEPRILLSPHIAWLSDESTIALRERASEEMGRVLGGMQLTSPVLV